MFAYRYRVAMCHRGLTGQGPLTIKRSEDGTRAEFRNVQTCGSVWHCPVCAPKIAGTRADEINVAIAKHIHAGGSVYFLTLTIQHDRDAGGQGQLTAQLDKLAEALSYVKGTRAWREVLAAAGVVGSIRGLETTYGEMNGWHPHAHEIIFAQRDTFRVLRQLRKLWARELIRRGLAGLGLVRSKSEKFGKLRALARRCCVLQHGQYASEYVAKYGKEPESWGMASELTRSHLKVARRSGHCNPWGLLCDYLEGDKRSGELFREYAEAFHRKRQIYWSRGLKALFQIAELEDAELAAAPDKRCTLFVATVNDEQWSLVLRYNARFELLRAAAVDGPLGVSSYLADLRDAEASGSSPPRFSGAFLSHPMEVFREAA